MTSGIAVQTNSGERAIILGTDKQVNIFDNKGDVKSRIEITKIVSGERWMISYAGDYNSRAFYKFFRKLEGDKRYLRKKKDGGDGPIYETPGEIVRRAVDSFFKEGDRVEGSHFREVYEANAGALREEKEVGDIPNFIVGAYFDKRAYGLWYVDEFGNFKRPEDHKQDEETIKDFSYLCIGSGGIDMEKYIEKQALQGDIETRDIDIEAAMNIVFSALGEGSSKDPQTGLFRDIVVLRKTGIVRFGDLFREEFRQAEERVKNSILEEILKK